MLVSSRSSNYFNARRVTHPARGSCCTSSLCLSWKVIRIIVCIINSPTRFKLFFLWIAFGFCFSCCKRNVSLQPTTNTIPLLHWRVTKCLWLQKVRRKWRKWLSSSFPQSHYKMQWNWNETEKESYKEAITREFFFLKDFLKLHRDWNWMFGYVVGIILNVFF